MIIGKIPFFLILFLILLIPTLAPRVIWLARSRATMGTMGFEGHGTAGEQIQLTNTYIYYHLRNERICFKSIPGLGYREGDPVPVRYLPADLNDARVNTFLGVWGDLLVFAGIPALILLISFLHPDVVPWGSRLRLTLKRPYIRLWSTHPNW
jgi:hypothetical protein